jgi:hypothetical protein
MPNKFVGAGKQFFKGFSKVFKGPSDKEGFGSGKRFATIGGVKPKPGVTRKSDQIKKSNRLIRDLEKTMKKDMSPQMKKRGEKLKKEVQKTQKEIYRTRKAEGGILGRAKKFLGKETPKRKPKSEAEINKITSSDAYKKADYKTKTKMLGGQVFTAKEMEEKIKKQKPSIKEQIAPKSKMDRLKQLREELGKKTGGMVGKKKKNRGMGGKGKKKFPDLTGDGKVTQADILKGRGVFRKGGASK